jgi:hypothetical protein
MRLNLDQLPKSASALVEVIGLPATLTMLERFGGRTIPVPKGCGHARYHELAEIIGDPAAQQLVGRYGGGRVDIPTCARAVRAVLHNEMRERFDRMTRDGLSARAAIAAMNETYRYSERHLWRITKAADSDGRVIDSEGQMTLF